MNRIALSPAAGLLCAVVGLATLAGCTSGTKDNSPTSVAGTAATHTESAAFCADVDALKKAVANVSQVTAGGSAYLDSVQSKAQAVASSATGKPKDDVTAVQADIDALRQATSSGDASLVEVATKVRALVNGVNTLAKDVASSCP